MLFKPLLVQILHIDYGGIKLVMSSEVNEVDIYENICVYVYINTQRPPTPEASPKLIAFRGSIVGM